MRRLAVFDLETTGVDSENDRIVSAFFGVLGPTGEIEVACDLLAQQEQEIPEGATAVHGITTEYANEHGEPLGSVLAQLYAAFVIYCIDEKLPLAGHNIVYDLTMFDRELERTGSGKVQDFLDRELIVLDSLVLDKHFDRYRSGKRTLITAAEVYGVELSEDEAHGAQADAIASGRIVQKMLEDFGDELPNRTAAMRNQRRWKKQQAASLQEYFRSPKAGDSYDPEAVVNGEWPLIPRGE